MMKLQLKPGQEVHSFLTRLAPTPQNGNLMILWGSHLKG